MQRLPVRKQPKTDETLLGYLMRLGRYYYNTSPMHLLRYAKVNVPSAVAVQTERTDLTRLGWIAGVDPETFLQMTYRPSRQQYKVNYFGVDIANELVSVHHRRACPECLAEGGYHQAAWDLSFSTACVRHRRWLLFACKRCGRKLNWHHNTLMACLCGSDYRRARHSLIPADQLVGLRYALKSLGGGERADGLGPGEVPSLMLFMGAILTGSRRCPRPIRLLSTPERLNDLLNTGLPILKRWPDAFYDYLDSIRASILDRPGRYGLANELGPLSIWLLAPDFPPAIARPIRAALTQYVAERPELRTRAKLARRAEAPMTLRETAKLLKRSYATVAPALRKHRLLIRDDGKGKGAPVLVRRGNVEALKSEMNLQKDKAGARKY